MFIAMNRFKVARGSEAEFEAVWAGRRSRLDEVDGFLAFHLLKGAEKDGHVVYASHSVWASRDQFTAWTRSEQFREAHRNVGEQRSLYLGPPEFEGFDAVLVETRTAG